MKNLFLFLAFSASLIANAQGPFYPGYIVTAKGDTVRGEVRAPKNELEPFSKVFFKDGNGLQKNYKPEKIKSYVVNNDRYVSMLSEGELAFYKVVTAGYITLYVLQFETIRMNSPILDSEYYFSHPKSKSLVIIKEGKFKKQIADYMKDNPEIAQLYEDKDKKFDPAKAQEVITMYNDWKVSHP
jgi:hypothetical protein